MFYVDFGFASFLIGIVNSNCSCMACSLVYSACVQSVQYSFRPPSYVELDVLTICLLQENMKEIHCISITSYVVGQHSTVASSTGRPCRGSSLPAGEWQCFLWEEQRECIESICIHNILVSFYLMLFQLIVWPPPHCLRCVDLQSVTRVNLCEPTLLI